MKIVTLCGSDRFAREMAQAAEQMALAGYCVITPITLTRPDRDAYTPEEIGMLGRMHLEKIRLSDAILVMNVGGYIGHSTAREIAYAKELGKEIRYYSELIS